MHGTLTHQKRIADRIRVLRQMAGISQSMLAHRMGLDKQNVQRLETGKHDPRLSTLYRVARGLGVKMSDLVAC